MPPRPLSLTELDTTPREDWPSAAELEKTQSPYRHIRYCGRGVLPWVQPSTGFANFAPDWCSGRPLCPRHGPERAALLLEQLAQLWQPCSRIFYGVIHDNRPRGQLQQKIRDRAKKVRKKVGSADWLVVEHVEDSWGRRAWHLFSDADLSTPDGVINLRPSDPVDAFKLLRDEVYILGRVEHDWTSDGWPIELPYAASNGHKDRVYLPWASSPDRDHQRREQVKTEKELWTGERVEIPARGLVVGIEAQELQEWMIEVATDESQENEGANSPTHVAASQEPTTDKEKVKCQSAR